jgi:hypothetical protein
MLAWLGALQSKVAKCLRGPIVLTLRLTIDSIKIGIGVNRVYRLKLHQILYRYSAGCCNWIASLDRLELYLGESQTTKQELKVADWQTYLVVYRK